ncbi:unnamed protein product [Taenia asiatica]|uniref:Amino acid transporter n=1 Tax=Taenia asiatica TaxID=60517 RepID=A0A0R3WEZ5_TAEAS|nr:unnamed protein product [Taenia asiatica]
MTQSNVPAMESASKESSIVVPGKPWRRIVIGCLSDNWFMITTIASVIVGFVVGFGVQRVGLSETGKTWLGEQRLLHLRIPFTKTHFFPLTLSDIDANDVYAVPTLFFSNAWDYLHSAIEAHRSSYDCGEYYQRNIFPDDIIGVTLFQAATDYNNPPKNKNDGTTYPSKSAKGTNMIGVLFCSLIFGIAANASKERGKTFKKFFISLGDVIMLLMQNFLLITPLGVMFMVMSSIAEVENITTTFISLGFFVLINVLGQLTHFTCMLLSLVVLCKNPFSILKHAFAPYFIAFATTSAMVSIPRAFVACDAYGIPKPLSRFVLPLAATMKSDASGVFIVASCLFVAQQQNVELDAAKVVIVVYVAPLLPVPLPTHLSIYLSVCLSVRPVLTFAYVTALPNIPSASVVAVITILESVGVNAEPVSLLYAVEWINDRLRAGNVALSHLYCTAFTYHAIERSL